MAKKIPGSTKEAVAIRAQRRCEYCQCPVDFSTHNFSVEHTIPVALGGSNEIANLALACQGCNGFKYTKVQAVDPISQVIVSLFNPRMHNWDDHFVWSEDLLSIIGTSSIGRATVAALKINRQSVRNLRFALLKIGQHPGFDVLRNV